MMMSYGRRLLFVNLPIMLVPALLGAASSPSWYGRSWQTDEGLPDNIVSAVAQTKDGFVWVATYSGLARFDGIRFREYAAANPAGNSSSTIQSMLLDRRGRLWLARNGGSVVCIESGQVTTFSPEDGSSINQRAREMAEDSEGGTWISFDNGQVFRIHDGRMRTADASKGLPSSGI